MDKLVQAAIYRSGKFVSRATHIKDCTRTRHINAADTLTVTVNSVDDIRMDDTLKLIELPENVIGGTFRVVSIERRRSGNGLDSMLVTAMPIATQLLIETGFPDTSFTPDPITFLITNVVNDNGYLDGLSLADACSRLTQLVEQASAYLESVKFVFINPTTGAPNIRVIDADTALSALASAVRPSNSRWRARPDIDEPTVEVGRFGDHMQIELKSISAPHYSAQDVRASNVFPGTASVWMESMEDAYNALFVSGGTYTDTGGKSSKLSLFNTTAPYPYTVHRDQFVDGYYHIMVTKDVDINGNPYPRRKSRRANIAEIAPVVDMTLSRSSVGAVATAEAALLDAAIAFLELYADGKTTWRFTAPFPVSTGVHPGDMVYATLKDEATSKSFTGWVYVISQTTQWNGGKVSSEFELSNQLDSLADPLSAEYAGIKASRQARI